MRFIMPRATIILSAIVLLSLPTFVAAQEVGNPLCPGEEVFYDPGNGEDIVVPPGYNVSVFASGLNSPTGIAFLGDEGNFQVFVLESGHGLPSRCNDETAVSGGEL